MPLVRILRVSIMTILVAAAAAFAQTSSGTWSLNGNLGGPGSTGNEIFVAVSNASTLNSATVEVHFDSTKLELDQSVSLSLNRASDLTLSPGPYTAGGGYRRYVFINISGNGIETGSGNVLKVAFAVKSGVAVGGSTTITLTDQGAKTTLATQTFVFTQLTKTLQVTSPQDGAAFSVDEGSPLAIRMRITNQGDSLRLNTGSTLPTGASVAGDTLFQWTPGQAQSGFYPVRLIYSNEGGGADTVNLNITVNDKNAAPVWPAQDDTMRVKENANLFHSFTPATDADPTDMVSYSALNLPSGAEFSSGGLILSWKPDYDQAGTYQFSLVATDNRGARATKVFTIIVENVNRKPALNLISRDYVGVENRAFGFFVLAGDRDNEPVIIRAEGVPSGATFNGSGFEWKVPVAGSYTVKFIATDTWGLADTLDMSIIINAVNLQPRFSALRDTSVTAGTAVQITLQATDQNAGDQLTYSVQKRGAATSILDRGATLTGGVLSWTPATTDIGPNIVYLRVTDSQGLYDEAQLTITVTGRNIAAPPSFKSLETLTSAEGDNIAFNLPLVDPNISGLKFWASNWPQGSKLDSLTGRFTWKPGYLQSGSYTVTFGVTDGNFQDVKNMLIVITERDLVPVLSPVGNLTVRENELLRVRLSGADSSGEAVSFTAQGLPAGAEFYSQGLVLFRPGYTQSGVYTVTFAVVDASGHSDQETVSLTVQDVNRPPDFTVDNKSVNENAFLSFTVSATDPDGDALTYAADSLPAGAAFSASSRTFSWTPGTNQEGNYRVLFTASDGKTGGVDSAYCIISVGDVNRPPQLDLLTDKTGAEGTALSFSLVASDPDAANRVTISAQGLPTGAVLTQSGTNPVTATVNFTPGYTQAGVYNLKFSATDNAASGALSVSQSMKLEISDVDVAPAFSGVLAAADSVMLAVSEGQTLEFEVAASDAGGDGLGFYTLNLPINASAQLSSSPRKVVFAPAYNQSGRHEFTVGVTDGRNEVLKKVVVTVAEVNRAPRVPPIADQKVTEGDIITFAVDATDPDGDAITIHTAGRVPFLTQGTTPPAKIRDGNVFIFDTALLPKDQPISSAVFKFWAVDSRGAVSDTVAVEIAVERRETVSVVFGSSTLPVLPGLGLFFNSLFFTGSQVNFTFFSISGFIINVPVPTLAAAGDESGVKVKQDPREGVYTFLAGDLTSQFYGIRRGWGLDLTALAAAGADSFPTGNAAKITLNYYDADLPTEVPNFTEARLSVFGYDGTRAVWVVMDSVSVDTVKNQAAFVPTDPRITDYTIGAVLDVVAPQVTNLKFSSGGVAFSPATVDTLHGLSGQYEVRINVTDDEIVSSSNARLYYSVAGGAYKELTFNRQSGNLYTALINEGALSAGTVIDYYIVVQDNMNMVTLPSGAPGVVNRLILAEQTWRPGDMDNNNKIDVFDLLGLLKVLGGTQPASGASDIDVNGKTDVFDLLALLRLLAK